MPKERGEELWHPNFQRVPVHDVTGRQNSSPNAILMFSLLQPLADVFGREHTE